MNYAKGGRVKGSRFIRSSMHHPVMQLDYLLLSCLHRNSHTHTHSVLSVVAKAIRPVGFLISLTGSLNDS